MHRQANHTICHLMCLWQILFACTGQSSVGREFADEWVEVSSAQYVLFFHLEIQFIACHTVFLCINENREIAVVMLYAWHVVPEGDAFYWSQCFAIFNSYLMACFNSIVNLTEVQDALCCTHLIHLAINTRSNDFGLTGKAEVLQIVNTLLCLFIVHHHCTTFNGIINLCGMKTQS